MNIPNEPFFTVPSRVFSLGLNPYELAVLFYLLMRADNEKHSCWPSVTSISQDCCISDAKVRRCISSLAEKEIIEIKRQYVSTKKGFRRQCSNYYKVILFQKDDKPPVSHTPTDCTLESESLYDIQAPPVREIGEINKTKSNITKTNITKPTELTLADAEAVLKERNSFLKLKEDCFEKLKNEYSLEGDYILLLDRSLENLWYKKSMAYEGKEYPREAIQTLLTTGITPSMLRASVGFFEGSSEPIRSPVAYLAKCIFGMLVNGECPTVSSGKSATSSGSASAENTVSAKPKREESITSFGSLDVDDFFSAALKRTYGDNITL